MRPVRRHGGVLVLRDEKRRAGCLSDARDPASTTHSYADMIGARMFAIACGYEDCDDLACCASIRRSSLWSSPRAVAIMSQPTLIG